ncbi:transcription factor IBH1-like 1 [Cannabis sativa]|uniref:transcription factor IBH1-like 1 n=1 Tax=Cannabis sativa TaxID=3483 RepID=UPI0029CA4723|nr:transcription factor IBH1-like 1 [Cannabis sativa]
MKNNLRLLKQEFLKKWIKGLQICSTSLSSSSSSSSNNNNNNNNNNNDKKIVGVLERKNAIKLSANLAMAFAKKGNTSWSRAIITKAANNSYSSSSYNYSKILYHNINNNINTNSRRRSSISYYYKKNKKKKKKNKVVKHYSSGFLAKKMVEKRREILKRLVPGGEECLDDEVCLIKETLDYILCLKAQVDVMRSLLTCNNHNVIYN